ncbi:MAG: hypothetical protein ACK5LL_02195 [Suipraeoptans sp.]
MTGVIVFALNSEAHENGFHPLAKVEHSSALRQIVLTLKTHSLSSIIIITRQRNLVSRHLERMGVLCVGTDDYDNTSEYPFINKATELLPESIDDLLIIPADYPLFSADALDEILSMPITQASELYCIQPIYLDKPGFPIRISISAFKEHVKSLPEPYKPEDLFQNICDISVNYETNDPGTAINLRYEENWIDALTKHKFKRIRPISRLTIAKDKVFFGPGIYQLLTAIEQTGSVRHACLITGISYSKGWQMIRVAEDQSGLEIVRRQKGGESGGYTIVTDSGHLLMKKYTDYVYECNEAIERIFNKYWTD